MSTSVSVTRTLALTALLASPTSAFAFSSTNHEDLTEAAFRVLADPGTVAELRHASLIGDTNADLPLAPGNPWLQSAAHFDNCAWSEGSAWIKNHRTAAVAAAIADDANPTRPGAPPCSTTTSLRSLTTRPRGSQRRLAGSGQNDSAARRGGTA